MTGTTPEPVPANTQPAAHVVSAATAYRAGFWGAFGVISALTMVALIMIAVVAVVFLIAGHSTPTTTGPPRVSPTAH